MSCANESCDGWCGICRGKDEREREKAAYARGKADGLAEAEARIIAWVRGEANEGYNEIQIADALERGEHKK